MGTILPFAFDFFYDSFSKHLKMYSTSVVQVNLRPEYIYAQ